MKHRGIIAAGIALALASQIVTAGSIADTYDPGDPLTASTMDNIKTAVNDNAGRVNFLENAAALSGLSCSTGEVAKYSGSAWACATDDAGTGDITSVNAGSGLSGGGTSGDVTLSIGTGTVTGSHVQNNSITNVDIANETGFVYTAAGYVDIGTGVTGVCSSAFTVVRTATIVAPSSGHVIANTSGNVCVYDASGYIQIYMTDTGGTASGDYDTHIASDQSSTARACAVGQYTEFSFNKVYVVTAGSKSVYIKACKDASVSDGNLRFDDLTLTFIPTEY